jgi:hypothetical protein
MNVWRSRGGRRGTRNIPPFGSEGGKESHMRAILLGLAGLVVCLAVSMTARATEQVDQVEKSNINGLWRGSLYGSDVQAQVEQANHDVKAEVIIHDMTGETNVYHVVGVIVDGHMVLLHGSGHVFDGQAHDDEISGILTTKGGTKVDVKASRVPLSPNGQGSSGQGTVPSGKRRPG